MRAYARNLGQCSILATFYEERAPNISPPPPPRYSIPFQNKGLHNFRKGAAFDSRAQYRFRICPEYGHAGLLVLHLLDHRRRNVAS